MATSQSYLTAHLNTVLDKSVDHTYSYVDVRVAVVQVLSSWPPNAIHEALNKLLPWGEEISTENKKVLAGLGESVEIFMSTGSGQFDSKTLDHVLVYAPMLAI